MNKKPRLDLDSKKYILELCFVGTNYEGWQSQPSGRTIQDHLNKALRVWFGDTKIKTLACSRTDSGVHAKQFFVTFSTSSKMDSAKSFLRSMQALLPKDVAVKKIGYPPESFHVVRDAVKKLYRYQIWNSRSYVDPFLAPYVWHHPANLDLEELEKAFSDFVGVQDFTSFAASDGAARTKIREIYQLELVNAGNLISIEVAGAGFLKQMVRNIVGTLVEVSEGKRDAGSIAAIIAQKDRTKAGRTAPASGLALEKVYYSQENQEGIHWLLG